MKIELNKNIDNEYCYKYIGLGVGTTQLNQEQYDYIFKYLDFETIKKNQWIYFNDKKTEEWFKFTFTTFISYLPYLKEGIDTHSPEGYQWLKNNFGKGVFKMFVFYSDKQELKTIVNRLINTILLTKE